MHKGFTLDMAFGIFRIHRFIWKFCPARQICGHVPESLPYWGILLVCGREVPVQGGGKVRWTPLSRPIFDPQKCETGLLLLSLIETITLPFGAGRLWAHRQTGGPARRAVRFIEKLRLNVLRPAFRWRNVLTPVY